jgi:hypothetical protein
MSSISILHIGDMHFNDIEMEPNKKIENDLRGVKVLSFEYSHNQQIRKNLFQVFGKRKNQAILLSGDFCSLGDIKAFSDCIDFLRVQFHENLYGDITKDKLFLVLGNHDVNKNSQKPDEKFLPFTKIITEKFFPLPPIDEVRWKIIENPDIGKILLIAVNSCSNWGNPQFHPYTLTEIIASLKQKGKQSEKEFDETIIEYFDRTGLPAFNILDVPFIEKKDIEEIIRLIRENTDCLPIIFTHHNILPKQYFQDKVFNGLINGGTIRNSLAELNRPIIFLHGHLHIDPIEVISTPTKNESKIIAISAPLLFKTTGDDFFDVFGFNEIKIIFSYGENKPIGCKIVSYRGLPGSNEIIKTIKKIPFFDPPESKRYLHDTERLILNYIYHDSKISSYYLSDFRDTIRDEHHEIKQLSDIEIHYCLIRMHWLGLIDYDGTDVEIYDDMTIVGNLMVRRLIP